MVKFTATSEGKILIGLGLSHENLKRLKAGKPIKTTAPDRDDIEIFIFAGDTEASLEATVKEFIGSNTKVRGVK